MLGYDAQRRVGASSYLAGGLKLIFDAVNTLPQSVTTFEDLLYCATSASLGGVAAFSLKGAYDGLKEDVTEVADALLDASEEKRKLRPSIENTPLRIEDGHRVLTFQIDFCTFPCGFPPYFWYRTTVSANEE
jgi:hypothetical protein